MTSVPRTYPDTMAEYLGTTRLFERDGKLWITLPRRVMRLWNLRAGDSVRWRKLPGRIGWTLTFFRRGQKLLPQDVFYSGGVGAPNAVRSPTRRKKRSSLYL